MLATLASFASLLAFIFASLPTHTVFKSVVVVIGIGIGVIVISIKGCIGI